MRNFQEQREVIINMIEKKIKYDINIEKPSTTKPVKQGGVLNYLGKQKTVNAPVKWRSSKDHPIAHLAYITKDEEKILVDLNLYGSLKGKPNKGPSGIMSLNGGGGGSGDSGGQGDSGPGGSDDGTGHGGPGPGQGQAGDAGYSDYSDAGMGAPGPGAGAGSPGPSDPGFSPDIGGIVGPGPGQQDVTGFGTDYSDADMGPVGPNAMAGVDMSTPALQSLTDKAMANLQSQLTAASLAGRALGMAVAGPIGGFIGGVIGSNIGRGVTAPGTEQFDQDYAKMDLTTDVRNIGPETNTPSGGGGITTIVPERYELYNNITTGDPVMDALIARYRIDPSAFGIR
jgi:hypothetical protein